MRRVAVVAAVGVAGWMSVVHPAAARLPRCAVALEAAPVRLPASIRISTRCTSYTISPNGRVQASARQRAGTGITWTAVAGNGARVSQRGLSIAVLAGGREVFRSRGRFQGAGVFATLGPGAVAFSYDRSTTGGGETDLYLAPFGGRERRLAVDEQPLGWTAAGRLLTWRSRRGVYLRSASGRPLWRLSGPSREIRFDQATRSLLVLSRGGRLERYRDGRWRELASLAALGLGRHTSFERLAGGLIGLVDRHHVAVLREDGTLFASARFRTGDVAGESGLVADVAGSEVAFAVTDGRSAAPAARQTVELLRVGDRRPRTLHRGRVPGDLCVRWATLAWHGRWLLYSVTAGKTLLLDVHARRRPLDLTPLLHRLAPHDGLEAVAWA